MPKPPKEMRDAAFAKVIRDEHKAYGGNYAHITNYVKLSQSADTPTPDYSISFVSTYSLVPKPVDIEIVKENLITDLVDSKYPHAELTNPTLRDTHFANATADINRFLNRQRMSKFVFYDGFYFIEEKRSVENTVCFPNYFPHVFEMRQCSPTGRVFVSNNGEWFRCDITRRQVRSGDDDPKSLIIKTLMEERARLERKVADLENRLLSPNSTCTENQIMRDKG